MGKEMIISPSAHETKLALLDDGRVVEIFVEREKEAGLVGSIYKGRVTRVLPGMQSAFVDIGLERDAFLYVSDFFENLEDYDAEPAPAVEPVLEEEPAVETAPALAETEPQLAREQVEVREEQPEQEERQPAARAEEPPLTLPERRPFGRGGGRGRHRRGGRNRHRGGRGRFDRDRGRRGPRPELPPVEYSPASRTPIVLPGESLAKYRNVTAPAAPAPVEAGEPTPTPAVHDAGQPEVIETILPPTTEVSAEVSRHAEAVEASERERPETLPEMKVSLEPETEPAAVTQGEQSEEEAYEETVETGIEQAEESEKEETGEEPEEATAESEVPHDLLSDSVTLAEIQRVRQYEERTDLPPSVQERTEGGVEWQRGGEPRRVGRMDGDRDSYRRGRGRGGRGRRGGRGPRGRGPDRRGPGPRRREGRPFHARPSRGQPAIAELLQPGQEIIVQIAKEQMGKKGARITSHITLPGRYLVYMPTIDHIGISRRIGTSEERNRLRRLLLEMKGTIPGGFVVRTAAAQCSEEELRRDIDYLVKLWHDVRQRAEETPAPAVLHRDLDLIQRVLRDYLTDDYERVWVDNDEEYARILDFMARFQPDMARRVRLYTKENPIFEEMGVQQEIDRALRPKVWLKSGGYIVINHTEALVAIDVNTGKFVGKGSTRLEDTIVKTNMEAVDEISRQIRLRDLGGIIIIDFIDMEDPRNRYRVMRAMEDALRRDRAPSKLLAFNEFGLVAITRKRSRQPLERLLCQPCPTCTGTGMVKSAQTLCYEIQLEARKVAAQLDAPELTIVAHPMIVQALKSREHSFLLELEEQTSKSIILKADQALHIEQYNIY